MMGMVAPCPLRRRPGEISRSVSVLVTGSLHPDSLRPVKRQPKRQGSREYRSVSGISTPFSTPSPFCKSLFAAFARLTRIR
ncbi:uncharacterized protein BKA55DRAFT_555585 [Fusarium redolens]|uniref:Uncharacterized protein n=1 Tax=Fusarium redolens TaxID=48865 RepID=A0A9P9KRY8_FUSRE|nr:uncharacterized protein BKA55DRAFT_555585 [Fusarium redolens]KAH7267424.1 hypothetical protein BKA55DRAFT_555585 [Fusarium redolens]